MAFCLKIQNIREFLSQDFQENGHLANQYHLPQLNMPKNAVASSSTESLAIWLQRSRS
jgi:hypothetical protein